MTDLSALQGVQVTDLSVHKYVVEEDEVVGRETTPAVEGDGTRLALPHQSPPTLPQRLLQQQTLPCYDTSNNKHSITTFPATTDHPLV